MATTPRVFELDSSSETDNETSPPPKRRKTLPPSKKRIPTFSSPCELVTFKIGNEEDYEEFKVHLEEACYHSKTLEAAFNGPFIEGQTKTYTIAYHKPQTFRLLVQYMYRHSLPGLHTSPTSPYQDGLDPQRYSEEETKSVTEEVSNEMLSLVHLWFLADYLQISRLQNLVLEHLERAKLRYNIVMCPTDVWNAGRMGCDSLLWKYTVDNFAHGVRIKDKRSLFKNAPQAVLIDIMIACQENEEPKIENYLVKEDREY